MAVTEVLKSNYSEMSSSARISFFAGAGIIIVLFIWGIFSIFKDNYTVLFSDLASQDAAAVIADLEKNKVNYKLSKDGQNILVEDDMVYKTRIKVANDVPMMNGGVGFEIFDKDDFGTTEFAQKINFQRALQGELARTIMALEEIKMARVHLVLPESSIFKRKESNSSASVTIILNKGAKLVQRQVTGIQKLVASSTPGLKAKNVTILNSKGITLVADEQDEHNVSASSKKLERKREVEGYLIEKAQKLLDMTFGTRVAFVTIDVALNFDNVKTTREKVIAPDKDGVNVSHKKEIRMKGNKKEKADTSRSTIEIDYALSKQIEQIVTTPGSIKRMSISIIVPKSLKRSDQVYIENIVGNAIGFNESRGDEIALTQIINSTDLTVNSKTSTATTSMAINSNKGLTKLPMDSASIYDNKYLAWVGKVTQSALQTMHQMPVLVFSLFVSFVLLLFFFKVFSGSSNNKVVTEQQSFSQSEKEQLLSDLKNWLATDSSK